MKKFIAILLATALLTTVFGVALWADPIGVGGSFTTLSSTSVGEFPGKGHPHGGRFAQDLELRLTSSFSPIGVGGS